MEGRRRYTLTLVLCAASVALGSGCRLLDRKPRAPLFPPVLQPGASLPQVIDAVNNNSRRIRTFSTSEAQLSGPGIPVTLRNANIVFERPRRLRIQAGTLMGSELDVGSNDELFWFWVRRSEPPAILFCRHDQYASCEAARRIPFEPTWLIEAFGIVEFSPNEQHQGPLTRPDGRLELLTVRQTPCGPATKKTVVDASTALVQEQHVYDYQGRVVASAVVREHRLDPLTNLVMPKIVDLQCPQAQLSMEVNLGNVTINQPVGGEALWTMPTASGWPMVNLADPNWWRAFSGEPAGSQAAVTQVPPYGSADSLRGFNRLR
ncbi:MAG: hypothetical protein ACYC6Y_29800 [Thermoguttaceae bacterium]